MNTALRFHNVSKAFDTSMSVVHEMTFTIETGECVCLVGPSGCGKSTILRLAAGLDSPTSGHVDVDRRSIGLVFQDSTLLPWRNALRNVELIGEIQGLSAFEYNKAARRALQTVGLADHSSKYPNQLSGGMRMRVALARALSLEPRLLLLDEPFSALDEISRQRLQVELRALLRSSDAASLFITHSVAEAVFIGTKVLCMSSSPGTIIEAFDIPFEPDRDESVRYTPEFSNLCRSIAATLHGART